MGGKTFLAADSLAGYLSIQLDEIEKYLPLVASDPEAVHEARVALRRFRSAVSCFSPLLPALPADDVGRLRTLARKLGEARDAYVLSQRLAASAETGGPWKSAESLRGLAARLAAQASAQAAAATAPEVVGEPAVPPPGPDLAGFRAALAPVSSGAAVSP